jgi:sodium/bile acid cotransporter 7
MKGAILVLILYALGCCAAAEGFLNNPRHAKAFSSLLRKERPLIFQRAPNDRLLLSASLEQDDSLTPKLRRIASFIEKNFFLMGMFFAVGFARAFPSLGKTGGILKPELIIGKYGVAAVFLLSGLSLELSQLTKAYASVKLNTLVQTIIFAVWPFLVGVPLTSFLNAFLPGIFPRPLTEGLLILTCLPTTVNMNVILTSASGGNVASALCNAVVSNLGGIFATPFLLFRFFGSQISLPFMDMLIKLANKVLLPVTIGQMLRATKAKDMYNKHSKFFKRLQEVILLSILWNAFCTAISENIGLELQSGIGLLLLLPILHGVSLATVFALFSIPAFGFSRGEVVASMFCAAQKTLAFGLPLINTIFEGNPNLAAYCAPIMFLHPLQLIIGSLLVPRLQRYTSTASR